MIIQDERLLRRGEPSLLRGPPRLRPRRASRRASKILDIRSPTLRAPPYPDRGVPDRGYPGSCLRTSENSVAANFGESPFHAIGCIKRRASSMGVIVFVGAPALG